MIIDYLKTLKIKLIKLYIQEIIYLHIKSCLLSTRKLKNKRFFNENRIIFQKIIFIKLTLQLLENQQLIILFLFQLLTKTM
ncbi:unnamed protein product [Paramecium sonneborni]|uniref:Uncharacterized protein n=1 Tax=Paramecium sonneborni TaxID=65129 RepID=A0A8S1R7W5_9CILI|nr:unnamed protein product [Paramecium sonneborni]